MMQSDVRILFAGAGSVRSEIIEAIDSKWCHCSTALLQNSHCADVPVPYVESYTKMIITVLVQFSPVEEISP